MSLSLLCTHPSLGPSFCLHSFFSLLGLFFFFVSCLSVDSAFASLCSGTISGLEPHPPIPPTIRRRGWVVSVYLFVFLLCLRLGPGPGPCPGLVFDACLSCSLVFHTPVFHILAVSSSYSLPGLARSYPQLGWMKLRGSSSP
jgi:hypothetical protein